MATKTKRPHLTSDAAVYKMAPHPGRIWALGDHGKALIFHCGQIYI